MKAGRFVRYWRKPLADLSTDKSRNTVQSVCRPDSGTQKIKGRSPFHWQSQATVAPHIQPHPATYSHIQPHTATYSHIPEEIEKFKKLMLSYL